VRTSKVLGAARVKHLSNDGSGSRTLQPPVRTRRSCTHLVMCGLLPRRAPTTDLLATDGLRPNSRVCCGYARNLRTVANGRACSRFSSCDIGSRAAVGSFPALRKATRWSRPPSVSGAPRSVARAGALCRQAPSAQTLLSATGAPARYGDGAEMLALGCPASDGNSFP